MQEKTLFEEGEKEEIMCVGVCVREREKEREAVRECISPIFHFLHVHFKTDHQLLLHKNM